MSPFAHYQIKCKTTCGRPSHSRPTLLGGKRKKIQNRSIGLPAARNTWLFASSTSTRWCVIDETTYYSHSRRKRPLFIRRNREKRGKQIYLLADSSSIVAVWGNDSGQHFAESIRKEKTHEFFARHILYSYSTTV